jgi:PPOX class probable F420-dependent enzyme
MSIVGVMLSGGIVVAAVAGAGGFPPDVATALRTSKEIYVATKRADGSQSKVVPVWFMYDGDAIYFATAPDSYKVKRIRHGSPLLVWVGSATGPHFVGKATLETDPELAARMAPVYSKKYWIAWLGLFRPNPERVRSGKTILVEVVPPQS